MKPLILGLIASLVLGLSHPNSAVASDHRTVAYNVSPAILNGALKGLDVELRFRGDVTGITTLDLPDHTGGHQGLWRNLRDLKVEGATSVSAPDDAHRIIKAEPNAALTIRYRVVSGIDHDPTDNDEHPFTPWIRPTWFYAVGEAVFVIPRGREATPASFDWSGAPRGFSFASDLEHLAGRERKASRPGTVDDVLESAMLGGIDVNIVSGEDRGAPLRVAMRGAYSFSEPQFFDLSRRIIDAERRFWGDRGSPFLITVAPVAGLNASSMSGRGRTDAFLLALTPDVSLEQVKYLLAHEYFHSWLPNALGLMADCESAWNLDPVTGGIGV